MVPGCRAKGLESLPVVVAFAVAFGVLLTFSTCGGGESTEQTPPPSIDVRSPSEETISPTPPAGDTSFRLVFQESGATEDKIWRVSPSNPTNREPVATIKHRDGWSVKASLSPDSRSIAYIAVPEGGTDASYQGELFMLDLKRQETELVYRGVDLRFRPMWTPDSKLLYVRRLFGMETLILQIKVIRKLAPGETPVATPSATTQALGEEKARAPPEPTLAPDQPPPPSPRPAQANFVVKLSDQIARDYDLSPDRKHLSYLAQEIVNGDFVLRPFTADLPAKTTTAISTDGLPPGDHFRPLWHPGGTLLAVGSLPTGLETGAVALVPVGGGAPSFLPAPERGFDVPTAWAADGSFLAVTNYGGDSLANVGVSRIDLVAPTGQRIILAEGTQFEVVGWFQPPA